MVKIKKTGKLRCAGHVQYMVDHPEVFARLNAGKTVEVPSDVAKSLSGISVIKESPQKPFVIKKSKKVKKREVFDLGDVNKEEDEL